MRRLLLALVVVAGCSGKRVDPVMLREAPSDLAVDVMVFGEDGPRVVRSRRPARYLLETGGVLRAEVGTTQPRRVYPGVTRRLTSGQVDGVWRLLSESGLLAEESTGRVSGEGVTRPSRGQTTALVTARYAGVTRSFRATLGEGGDDSRRAEEIVDRLASLAGER